MHLLLLGRSKLNIPLIIRATLDVVLANCCNHRKRRLSKLKKQTKSDAHKQDSEGSPKNSKDRPPRPPPPVSVSKAQVESASLEECEAASEATEQLGKIDLEPKESNEASLESGQ